MVALLGDQFVTDLFVPFAEIASSGMPFPGEREPFGGFGTVRELGSNDVQQFLGSDVAAGCFGVEPGGKFFNGDRYQPNVRSSPAMLHDIIVNCTGATRRESGVVDALRSDPSRR